MHEASSYPRILVQRAERRADRLANPRSTVINIDSRDLAGIAQRVRAAIDERPSIVQPSEKLMPRANYESPATPTTIVPAKRYVRLIDQANKS